MVQIKRTLIFAPETFNLAETTRAIEVAKKCSEHFRCVFVGYSKKYSDLIEQSQFLFLHLEPHLSEKDVEQLMSVDQMRGIKHPFTYKHLKTRVTHEKKIIRMYEPVAVVIGTTLSLLISSRASKTPLVYIKPLAYTRTFFLKGRWDLPDALQKSYLPQKIIKNLTKNVALCITYKPRSFAKLAKEEGVVLPKYTIDCLDADFNLITTIPEISQVIDLPTHYKYIGPVYAKLDAPIPDFLRSLPKGKPVIYFAMGSSGSADILVRFLRVLEALPFTIVCPMKRALEADGYSFKSNIYLCDYLPAHKIGELIDVSVIHGGEGTVQTACLSGKPFLGYGLQQEQHVNINQCVKYGNAISLKKKDVTKEHMHRLIDYALTDKRLRQRASDIKQLLQGVDGPANAAAFLIEQFATKD